MLQIKEPPQTLQTTGHCSYISCTNSNEFCCKSVLGCIASSKNLLIEFSPVCLHSTLVHILFAVNEFLNVCADKPGAKVPPLIAQQNFAYHVSPSKKQQTCGVHEKLSEIVIQCTKWFHLEIVFSCMGECNYHTKIHNNYASVPLFSKPSPCVYMYIKMRRHSPVK